MRRPLLAVCICIVTVMAIWLGMGGAGSGGVISKGAGAGPPDVSWDAVGIPGDGKMVTVTGKVYRKDFKYFYLDSFKLDSFRLDSFKTQINAADQQQNHSFNLQCESFGSIPRIGSIVTVQGTWEVFPCATNPGAFDAAEYYGTLGLAGRLTQVTVIENSEDYSALQEGLFWLRKYFRDRLFRIFPEKEASIMSAMLLGDKSELDGETKRLYQENGIIHILSISGLHITLIGMGIYRLLRHVGMPVWAGGFAGGVMLLLYGVMTGMSISACRAIGMFLIRMMAEIVGRTYDMLTAVGIMAMVLVMSEPRNLQNAGFLLSFGAIAGIGVLCPVLKELWEDVAGEGGRLYEERPLVRFLRNIGRQGGKLLGESLLSGLSVTLMTLPIQLWFYYEVPIYAVLLNLLVIPFMTGVMWAGLAALLIPGAGLIGTVDCIILAGYEALCRFFSDLPFSVWNPGRPKGWQILAYYGVLGMVVAGVLLRAGRRKRRYCCLLSIGLLVFLPGIFSLDIGKTDRVTFLDVGQGDCICVEFASGPVFLFDCGSTDRNRVGEYVLKPFLKYSGISHVDGVFLSHPDRDHYSGIGELLEKGQEWNISVGQLVVSPGTEEVWKEILGNTGMTTVQAGDSLQMRDMSMLCLHPSAESVFPDSNAGSQCFYLEFGQNMSLLLTGDVEGEGEKALLAELKKRNIRDITLLKVAHHGSQDATGSDLLQYLQPDAAVISCGRNNNYGHPHKETLERLELVGSRVLTTPEYGAIIVEIKEKEMRIYGYAK
ncbi:MAG: DNA internalization-related competence protein ComEC/Rec2 [Lachnospiraceae bacterium]|nr:DNA internalization-related competence protein ComEC/Rec2 [Lachnospiraceae bacterium]